MAAGRLMVRKNEECAQVPQNEVSGVSRILADLVAVTSWADVAAQEHEAKRSLLNFFATALGSAHDPAVTIATRTLLPFSGPATSSVIGRDERLDALFRFQPKTIQHDASGFQHFRL